MAPLSLNAAELPMVLLVVRASDGS